ncbi:hypothetical protein OROGR_004080 [Orobanche gracilis]
MNNLQWLLSATAVVLFAFACSHVLNKFYNPNFSQLWLRGGEVADLVVTNGRIYTCDAAFPSADSMAIGGGRILRLGDFSSVQDLAGSKTRTLNLQGKLVVPGFIDSHVHLIFGGLQEL